MADLRVVPLFAPPPDVEALRVAKLASSGLTAEDGDALRFRALTAAQVRELNEAHLNLPAMILPYYDPFTGEPLSPRPNWPALYRLRYLLDPVPMTKDFRRYDQLANTSVAAFYPRLNVDWPAVLQDWRVPLIITEGEFKSACGCKHGFPTIGLGGVDSWRTMKNGYSFLPDLEKITWPRRTTYIIFDSDARTNENVIRAMKALADELNRRGALPMTVILPSDSEVKVGLDDFLVKHGAQGLRELLLSADHLTLAEPLWSLNERYVYVRDPGLVVRQAKGKVLKPEALKGHAETATYMKGEVVASGAINRQLMNAGAAWLEWPMRREVESVAYCPGKDPFAVVEDDDGTPVYNLWPGWACQPRRGDVKLFTRLIDHLFTGAEPEAKRFFLQWLAYPLVHPGTKLLTSCVLWSGTQGVGKTLVGVTMRKIYGDSNYTEITQELLSSNFNDWARAKQMIVGDDVTGPAEKRRELDRLKTLITATHVRINEKHIPAYTLQDKCNFMWTSNHADAFFLETNDRRFFIHEVTVAALPDAFYAEYDAWLRGPDAGPAIFDYLLNFDLAGFNPNAKAMDTAAKRNMIQLAKTDIDSWIGDMLEHPDDHLKVGAVPLVSDILTLKQLRAAYESFSGAVADVSQIGFARKLAGQGVRLVNGGKNLYVPHADLARYYVVRNREKWHKATIDQVKRYLGGVYADARGRF